MPNLARDGFTGLRKPIENARAGLLEVWRQSLQSLGLRHAHHLSQRFFRLREDLIGSTKRIEQCFLRQQPHRWCEAQTQSVSPIEVERLGQTSGLRIRGKRRGGHERHEVGG